MSAQQSRPPTGTVTFLFTDIVGSTEAWEQHGDAYLPVLQAHNAILTEAVARFGGYIIKTEGDSYKVAFSDPAAAARCAVVAQAALHRYPWPQDVGPVRVRMALHTGDPFVQSGDYFGPSVNRTARILSAAHGGQILLSEEVEAGIRGSMESGTRCIDLGCHKLKDLGEPARLFQLDHPALEDHSVSAPKSLNAHAHNLPLMRRTFVGREKEIEQIVSVLTRSDTPLLKLTGRQGIGKTRLSLQAAAEQIEWFPDGVWYVRLERAGSLEETAADLAASLGIGVTPGSSAMDAVRRWVAERRCLLILDDCGHVPRADRLIRELLSNASALRCLAISRESLQIEEGAELEVPSMSVPRENADAAAVMASEAGRLFVERVHEERPDFELTDRRAKPVSRLLRTLKGIPELTEAAAALMRGRSVPTRKIVETLAQDVRHGLDEVAHRATERGRALLTRLRDTPSLAALLNALAEAADDRRDLAEAERILRADLQAQQAAGDRAGIARTLRQLGNIAFAQRDHRRAVVLLTVALRAHSELQSPERAQVFNDLEYARRALGADAHTASLSLERAVAYAMGRE